MNNKTGCHTSKMKTQGMCYQHEVMKIIAKSDCTEYTPLPTPEEGKTASLGDMTLLKCLIK